MTPLWALTRQLATWLTFLSVPFALAAGAAAQQKQTSFEELLKRLLRHQHNLFFTNQIRTNPNRLGLTEKFHFLSRYIQCW